MCFMYTERAICLGFLAEPVGLDPKHLELVKARLSEAPFLSFVKWG